MTYHDNFMTYHDAGKPRACGLPALCEQSLELPPWTHVPAREMLEMWACQEESVHFNPELSAKHIQFKIRHFGFDPVLIVDSLDLL